jgi:hypothetical protein
VKESLVLNQVRLAVQKLGTTLFRNTVGRFEVFDKRNGQSRWVQAGLCVGSSDGIGLTEYTIKPEDVGRRVAVFTAIETKRPFGGRTTVEQQNFVQWVKESGGIAGFATSTEEAEKIIRDYITGEST